MRRIFGILYKHIKPWMYVIELEAQKQDRLERIRSEENWHHNPYYQINANADTKTSYSIAKNADSDRWYTNPLRFVDAEDLFHEDGMMRGRKGIMAIAGEYFRTNRDGAVDILTDSLYGNVPGTKDIQKHVLKNMLRDALISFSHKVTKAQIQALVLAREADRQGKTATMYIAKERKTSREAAYMLLKRAEEAILLTSSTQNAIIEIEAQIKKRARELPRVCSVCGNVCDDNLKALCEVCHVQYVYRGEFFSEYHRQDVENGMRLSSFNHWRKARDLVLSSE